MKQIIRLAESDIHKIVKETVKKVLNEKSYRKAAKNGEHTSSTTKHELNYQKKMGYIKPKEYHKFAEKMGSNKRDVNTICDFEDARDAGKICETAMNEGLSFKMKVWEIINDALYNAFGDDFGDQEMIEKAKIGVAMKNSQPVVLEHAKYVTLSNEEDGVAHFIEDNLLK